MQHNPLSLEGTILYIKCSYLRSHVFVIISNANCLIILRIDHHSPLLRPCSAQYTATCCGINDDVNKQTMTEEEAKKPRISRDHACSRRSCCCCRLRRSIRKQNVGGRRWCKNWRLNGTVIIISLSKATTPYDALDDREKIVRRQHPIVFRVVPYEGTHSLLTELAKVSDVLRLSPSIASAQREDIMNELVTIYGGARSRKL